MSVGRVTGGRELLGRYVHAVSRLFLPLFVFTLVFNVDWARAADFAKPHNIDALLKFTKDISSYHVVCDRYSIRN